MCCGNTCTKYLLFIFNFIFALAGIALLVVGALTQAKVSEVNEFLAGKFSGPPIVLIVLGSIIFVISFFGCCGAIRDSTCMLTTFAVFLILILLAGVAIAITAFVLRNKITGEIDGQLREAISNYNNIDSAKVQVDAVQRTLRCCGADGPINYLPNTLPDTCCEGSIPCTQQSSDLFTNGCSADLKKFIEFSGVLLGGLAIGVALIMIIGIVLSLGLVRAIKRNLTV